MKIGKPFYHEFYKTVDYAYKILIKRFNVPDDLDIQNELKSHLIKCL